MPRAKARASVKRDADETAEAPEVHGIDRAINVLALMLVKGAKQGEAIALLHRAGFAAREVAALLGTSPNAVSVTLYKDKKNGKKAKTRGAD